jgi:enterochelin esterase-like enzyme
LVRQETYFVNVVVPLVEKAYPAIPQPQARLLLGFSKSGWGAWSLLLRHPDRFGRAAAWDAPMMMDAPGKFGSGPIFGTPDNFAKYQLTRLLRGQAEELRAGGRLLLLGKSAFAQDHARMHALLDGLRIRHEYREGPERKHDWHSGWVREAVDMLLAPAQAP